MFSFFVAIRCFLFFFLSSWESLLSLRILMTRKGFVVVPLPSIEPRSKTNFLSSSNETIFFLCLGGDGDGITGGNFQDGAIIKRLGIVVEGGCGVGWKIVKQRAPSTMSPRRARFTR